MRVNGLAPSLASIFIVHPRAHFSCPTRSRPDITGLFIQPIIVIEPALLKHPDPLAQVSGVVVVAGDCLVDRFDFFSSQSRRTWRRGQIARKATSKYKFKVYYS